MEDPATDRYTFNAIWRDEESSEVKNLELFYFPSDKTVQLVDKDKNVLILRRTRVPGLRIEDLYIGASVVIHTRVVHIFGFANSFTERELRSILQTTFCLIKPDGVPHKGKILKMICEAKFKIAKIRMLKFTHKYVPVVFDSIKNDDEYPFLLNNVTSGPSIAIELVANNAVARLLELAGPSNPEEAKIEAPGSIRALFGTSPAQNVIHASGSFENAKKELDAMFGDNGPPNDSDSSTCILQNSTCCIIKPHALREGALGSIINDIETSGFKVTAMQSFLMPKKDAEEFYEVYNTVVPEYLDMVAELSSGTCVALEVVGNEGSDTVRAFRELVGPTDPGTGKQVRPSTLRAKYGRTKIKNALHATDLPEDGVLEAEYFFLILS